MRVRIGHCKLPLSLLLGVLLGLFVLGPPGSVFAELDEPPRGVEPVLQGDGNTLQERWIAGLGGLDSEQADREVVVMDNLRRGVLASVSWIFLVVGLFLVALTLRKTYIWLRALQKARVPPTRHFNLQLQVQNRDGELGLYNFDYYPVVVATSGSADLLFHDIADTAGRFRIDYLQGQAHLFSDSSTIVNGVPRQRKALKQDDRIIFGPYRLTFKDASIREQSAPIPGKPVFVWQFPIVALLLALSILFRQAGAVPEDRMRLAEATELQSAGQQDAIAVSVQGSVEQPEGSANEEVSPERITLGQRLRRLVEGWRADADTLVQEQGAVQAEAQKPVKVSVAQPAIPAPELLQRSSAGASATPTPAAPTTAAPTPEPQTPESRALEPERLAMAESPSGQTVPVERISPRREETAQRQAPPSAVADTVPPHRRVAAAQPAPPPARKSVPTSDPPLETTAEVPAPRSVDTSPVKEETSLLTQSRATQQSPLLQASVLATIAPPTFRNNGINPLEGLGFAKAKSVPQIGRVKVRVIPPGRPIEYFKADMLFIHAHPDDESIDFGSLMSMASRSNKRIITLLFTDGESGLDLYPQRVVGDIYPARVLAGGALSQVRVVEATRALSILGSEMYVRWGLVNRPYNTKADEVPPEEVIRGWGGEDWLVERLIEVLEGFRPTIVVSPDRKSGAYEHFEHEAVGQLVQTAIERLRRAGGASFLKGHLISIDPYQVDHYDGVADVDAQARDFESGLDYRSIQALALQEHITQRDAALIAVRRLSHLPREFYKALFWDLDLSLEDYLK